jgi:diguanylate cyclase (GGDEF)-like protein
MEKTKNDCALDPLSANVTWQRLRDALLGLASTPFNNSDEVLERILRTDAEALGVGRVSLWLFDPGQTGIVCIALFESSNGLSRPETRIPAAEAPAYFQSLRGLLTLSANDAKSDPRTREFKEAYLEPLGIGAMLDVPVRMFGEMVGVLCHEHIGEVRVWSDIERIFAAALGVLCSQTMEFEKLQNAKREREQALFYDRLTGLPNRALFLDRIGQAKTHSDAALVVFCLNESIQTFGPSAGDAILNEVGSCLIQRHGAEFVARTGDEQFSVLLDGKCSGEGAAIAARDLRDGLLALLSSDPLAARFTISMGVVTSIGCYKHTADAMTDAVIAQNSAAQAGRNRVVVFHDEMATEIRSRLALEADIRRGMLASEFCFFLQPIFSANGELQGAEALLRWQHPERGLLAPSEFLAAAEGADLLAPLHWNLLGPLFSFVSYWRKTYCPTFQVAVNISPTQLDRLQFPDDLLALILSCGLGADAIVAEITENTLLAHSGRALPVVMRLAATGVGISLDDFGTGHASLSHLAQLPLKSVKIDREFVDRAMSDTRYAEVTATLIGLSQRLGFRVVAEGVETAEQKGLLTKYGCDQFQGYFLGRPHTVSEFESRWIR